MTSSGAQPAAHPHAFAPTSASAILIVRVGSIPSVLSQGWAWGPLPVRLPRETFPEFLYSDAADQRTREGFLERRVHGLLYGSDREPVRQHLWIGRDQPELPGGWRVRALELLSYPAVGPDGALLAVHVVLAAPPESASSAVSALSNVRPLGRGEAPGTILRPQIEGLIDSCLPGAVLTSGRVGFVVSHVAFRSGPTAGVVPGSTAEPALQWSRLLGSANKPDALPDSLMEAERQPCDISLSTSWEACVLKSGAAFVGRTGTDVDRFHELGKALVHSNYLDTILLGLIQRDCVEELSNSISDLWEKGAAARRATFERNLIRFRSEAWWSDISETTTVNDVLCALQDIYDLQERQDRLHSDIGDISRVLAGERAERTNLLLNVIAGASVAFGLAALIADPGRWAIVWGIVWAGVTVAALVWMEWKARRD